MRIFSYENLEILLIVPDITIICKTGVIFASESPAA